MSNALRERLKRLEAEIPDEDMPECPAGMVRIGRGLFVPKAMAVDEWSIAAAKQQAELATEDARQIEVTT